MPHHQDSARDNLDQNMPDTEISDLYARGFGQDTLNDVDGTAGNTDVVRFLGTIAPSEINVTRDRDSLYIAVNGTDDRIKIENWFATPGAANVEEWRAVA